MLYKANDINIKLGNVRILKSMLNNRRNTEDAGDFCREYTPELIERVKQTKEEAQQIKREVASFISRPW